ncbi:aminotransferase class I/II-fold pyridoxal phosphate-dependent enzyme [Neobacillus niacini]|uniref:DegT/DnrJ/EryC1/StrS family aminotransferase n=1 Tax=Neobacillus niacini TaxID=86668 RepID=UPI002FFF7772
MVQDKEKIYLSLAHMSGNEQRYINDAFEKNWIAPLGPNVDGFEKELATSVGVNAAVAVSSGTAAIHLALKLLNVGPGDRVFCSTLTFVASANPILYQGAEPVFIDSEPETWNMSPQALERAMKDAALEGILPKAVIVVHLYGQSAKMDKILYLCNKYNIPVIEDSAESLGSTYKGKASGTMGNFGIYSFNGNKIITTSGGGMLVSNDVDAINKARFLATQAKDPAPYYQHSTVGYNYRMSNVLAGIGRAQLEVLEERVKARREIFNFYYQHLSHLPGITFMKELENTRSNRWLTTLLIEESDAGLSNQSLLEFLSGENIEARHVWKPLHMQPIFKGVSYYSHEENKNVSEEIFNKGICLPSGSGMTEEQQRRVINNVLNVFSLITQIPM